jgi:hypothetical protein
VESPRTGIDMRDNTLEGNVNSGEESASVGKKKPPPPPIKRAALASGTSIQAGPPPIPLSTKPKTQVSSHS